MLKKVFLYLIYLVQGSLYAQFGFVSTDTVPVIESGIEKSLAWLGGLDNPQFSNIDLNQDGIQDLFIFDRNASKVLTFIQNGSSGQVDFTYAPEYESAFPQMTEWALLKDYNCDGKVDIFTHTIGGIRVYINTSTSTNLQFDLVKSILKTNIYGNDVYMYASSVDIPAIVDIDNDGDIDILSFGVGGSNLEYQRNMSMENYGICDSLEYITGNICWGLFKEASTSNTILLNQPCPGQVANPYDIGHPSQQQDRHSGSTVLALDLDASGVMDLLLGDISYNTLTSLINGGTSPNTNSAMVSFNSNYPNSFPVNIPIFPAGFYVDVTNDGVNDLIVASNSTQGFNNFQAVWYYQNSGTNNLPYFNFIKNDFLQGEMIDVGSSSYPVFFDHNGDGLKDLLVSVQKQYVNVSNDVSKIAYYENTGTFNQPEFSLITDDYLGFSTMGIGTNLNFYPTFGDIDNDGDEDLILGEYSGYCYLFENTAGVGNAANFVIIDTLKENDGTYIIDGTYPIPQLFDIDNDNDLDLILGKRDGTLNYYENIGDSINFTIKLMNNNLGNVNVTETGFFEGRAVPSFVKIDSITYLLVGSKSGYLHHYTINTDSLDNGSFILNSSTMDNINQGAQSAPAIYGLMADNTLLMTLGNIRGGLSLYQSGAVSNVSIKENQEENIVFELFPNPATQIVTVTIKNHLISNNNNSYITITDQTGRSLYKQLVNSNQNIINISNFAKGVYFITYRFENTHITKKLIINE